MKLYELTGQFNALFEMALEGDTEMDLTMIENTLQSVEWEFEMKVDGVAKMIRSLEKTAEAFDDESKRLADKAESIENKISGLKFYLLQNMEQVAKDKIPTSIGTVSRRRSPASVVVADPALIPAKYWITPPPPAQVLDRKSVLADLKQGPVPGAELRQGYHIRIQ